MKECEWCDMPMEEKKDFFNGNPKSKVCSECGKRGRPPTEQEIYELMKKELMKDGMTKKEAEETVKEWQEEENQHKKGITGK
jgi:hypothetical protein